MLIVPTPFLPPLTIAKTLPRAADVLVIGLTDNGLRGVPAPEATAFSKRYGTSVEEMARSVGARADAGSSRTLPAAGTTRIVVVGLGTGVLGAEDLRRAAAVGVRQAGGLAAEHGTVSVAMSFDPGSDAEAQAVAEGALLGCYRYVPQSATTPDPNPISSIAVVHATRGTALADAARTVAEAVVTAREWINIPANLLYPETFAADVTETVKDVKVAVEVLDEKALARDGYGGLLAVGGGSTRPPRLVRLSYRPRGAKFHLALVGKGITFDTGGLNIKPGDSMYTMKCDMSGAAAVFAVTRAIAKLGLKIQVTTYGALAENMPSGSAYRPSDVLSIYGGKTVENSNSDAEGRIVMADALVRAAEDQPDLVIDVATLTGACVVALGERTAGLMTNDEPTADRVLNAAEVAGEDFWQLPIPKETRAKLDSKVADLRSAGTDRWGGAMVAAAFLREFVAEGTPWAHLDIAGPAFFDGKPYGYVGPGGTGFGVRTLITLARALAA
jgi:leucyl aminopeptidase